MIRSLIVYQNNSFGLLIDSFIQFVRLSIRLPFLLFCATKVRQQFEPCK